MQFRSKAHIADGKCQREKMQLQLVESKRQAVPLVKSLGLMEWSLLET